MKVFLDGNFNIKSVTDDVGDVIVRGSNSFDKLYVYVPTSVISDYTTISPLYAVKRADGRELGKYATLTNHASGADTVANYYGWYGFFNQRDICVAGPLEITISFSLVKNGIASEKNVCKVTVNVKDGVMVDDDVLILNDSNWVSLKTSIEALATNLANKADRNNSQQEITANEFYGNYADIIELVSNSIETLAALITNLTVREKITATTIEANTIKGTALKQNNNDVLDVSNIVDNLNSYSATRPLSAKQGKILKDTVDGKVNISDVIDDLTSTFTDKPLSAYQGKLLKQAIDNINNLLQSNDTDLDELQEIVNYIKNNKSLIDGITTGKVSVGDIVDNLNSDISNKPLSAKQGYILKGLIDSLQTAINNRYTKSETDDLLDDKADKSTTYTKVEVDNKLALKQNITIPTITIAGVNYTNLEQAIGALNEYAKTIEQVIGSISGTDTTIVTRLTQLETSLSNLNTAWNNFTTGTSADSIINTLSEIRDELTSLDNSITAETNRATSQENKSLYHLGAFDTISGNTITRQTWEVDLSKLNWTKLGNYNYIYYTEDLKNIILTPSNNDTVGDIISNIYKTIVLSLLRDSTLGAIAVGGTGGDAGLVYVNAGTSGKPKGLAQIKLATPYIQQVIEGESILPLDANMANKIRQDVVEALNLWLDQKASASGSGITITLNRANITMSGTANSNVGVEVTFSQNITLKAGTYTLNNAFGFYMWSSDRTLIYFAVDTPTVLTSDTTFTSLQFNPISGTTYNYNSNIMLVKGSHPYPYEPYHANKHITDEEATLLKQEEEKCRNLLPNSANRSGQNINIMFDVNIEAGKTYTFSIQGGTKTDAYALWLDMNGTEVQSITEGIGANYSKTFTATANANHLGFYPNNINGCNIMLNYGSHPYPYEPYHANKHITDEESEVLKAIAPSPTTAGTYKLQCVVDSNGNPSFSWVADN